MVICNCGNFLLFNKNVTWSLYLALVATKGFVSRRVLTPRKTATGSPPDLLSWSDPPPKYSEKPAANELLSLLDPLSSSSNQLSSSSMAVRSKSGSGVDLKSAGLVDSDVFTHSYVSHVSRGLS